MLGSYWNNWYSGYWDNAYYGYPYYGYSAYYGYPVYDDYDYGYDYAPAVSVAPEPSDTAYADQPIANTQDEYLEQAVTAFQSGDYREAQRLAGHAVVDNPRDAAALELISLSAMGLGNYQAAAAEAHAVASLNGVPSWSQIYSFYGDLDRFTPQLRALETFVGSHPEDAPSQFLLGSLYLSMGYRAAAQQRLSHVVALAPNDRVAQQLLIEAGGQAPATAAQTIAPESSNAPIAGPPGGNPPGAVGVGNGAPPSSPPLPVPDDRSVSNPPSTAPATAAVPTGLRYY